MSFVERLKELRAIENAVERRRKSDEEKERANKRGEENREIEELGRLRQLGEERILPIFNTVKEVYVEGDGLVYINEILADWDEPHTFHIYFGLEWDRWGNDVYAGGKKLELHLNQLGLNQKQTVEIQGVNPSSPIKTIELGRGDWRRDWQKQVENAIYFILGTSGACDWSHKKFTSADYR